MLILYLEDHQPDAALVSRYVQTTPHEIIVATSMDEARQAMAQQPDLVLVDVVLKQTREGFTFIRELRESGYAQPIIAVTGLSTPKDLDECEDTGVDYILNKPFSINQLADVIRHYA
jgi:CheY-like chemotaxis protein